MVCQCLHAAAECPAASPNWPLRPAVCCVCCTNPWCAVPETLCLLPCRSTLALGGVLSQTELLTFILFWTLSNNICYLF